MANRYMKKVFNITNHQENPNQNYNVISPNTVRMGIIKNTRDNQCGEKELLMCGWGDVNWYSLYGKQYGGCSKIKK